MPNRTRILLGAHNLGCRGACKCQLLEVTSPPPINLLTNFESPHVCIPVEGSSCSIVVDQMQHDRKVMGSIPTEC